MAQLAMIRGSADRRVVENIFNFPTLAEGYRVAALDVLGRLAARNRPAAAPRA
jgi:NAD(P) transhydrogenase